MTKTKGKQMAKKTERLKAYLMCCEPRIVLMGYATPTEIAKEHPTLTNSRMAVYWSADVKGVLGLAATGPSKSCRVTPAVSVQTIRTKVETVIECTPEAEKAWSLGPWA